MTTQAGSGTEVDVAGGSRFWRPFIALFLRTTPRPMIQRMRRSPDFPVQEVAIVGRSSGLERRLFLGIIPVGDARYLGSSNGTTHWTRNLEASGTAEVIMPDGRRMRFTATKLGRGPERSAVIEAVGHSPFPAGLIYRLADGHVDAVGRYFRIEPVADAEVVAPPR